MDLGFDLTFGFCNLGLYTKFVNLINISTIKNILKTHGFWAKKYLGQHFLIDDNIIQATIQAADLKKDDLVIEIGPGIGALTSQICPKVKKIIAVEIDPKLTAILKENFKECKNLEIINTDILKTKISEINTQPYKIISSLPYQITGPFFKKFLELEKRPQSITLILQKEVAERVCAKPPRMNSLALLIQFYGEAEIIKNISKKSFWPKPEVESALIKIVVRDQRSAIRDIDERLFFRLIKAAFVSKRKKILNSLSGSLNIDKAVIEKAFQVTGLDYNKRPQEFSLGDWIKIYQVFSAGQLL